jgi:hypothetical protein
MLQDMDSMEAGCDYYDKVGMLNHLEHSQTWLPTVKNAGKFRLTVQSDLVVCVTFMSYAGDLLRRTSADILSLQECPINN